MGVNVIPMCENEHRQATMQDEIRSAGISDDLRSLGTTRNGPYVVLSEACKYELQEGEQCMPPRGDHPTVISQEALETVWE